MTAAARQLLLAGLLLAALASAAAPAPVEAQEPGRLAIEDFSLVHAGELSRLDAVLAVTLAPPVVEALRHGVPITFRWRFQLRSARPVLWDQTLWEASGRLRLDYRPLSRRYSLFDSATGAQQSFPDLPRLLEAVRRFSQPLPPLGPVVAGQPAVAGRLRLQLDLGALPPALRLPSFLDRAWRKDSGWMARSLAAPTPAPVGTPATAAR